jgi:hypothetical protein
MTKARDIADGGGGGNSLGTVTANDVDLSTGNFFAITADDQTLSFSGSPAVHDFKFQVTGANTTSGFALSSASYDSVSFSVSSQEGSPRDLVFNTDGTKMFVIGNSSDSVYQYTLSTGFDLSTASYDSVSFSVSSQSADPSDLSFNADGTKMYMVGVDNSTIFQYSTAGATAATINYPSSVKFPSGTPPATPANAEVDTIGIYTIDSGTSYYLYLVSDNQS